MVQIFASFITLTLGTSTRLMLGCCAFSSSNVLVNVSICEIIAFIAFRDRKPASTGCSTSSVSLSCSSGTSGSSSGNSFSGCSGSSSSSSGSVSDSQPKHSRLRSESLFHLLSSYDCIGVLLHCRFLTFSFGPVRELLLLR